MKKILALLLVAFATSVVSASTLYWQVDTGAEDAVYTGQFQYAALQAVDSSGNVNSVVIKDFGELVSSMGMTTTELGDYGTSSYSFFVELANASGESVYRQASPMSYNDLLSSGYISTGGLSTPSGVLVGGYNGASVPEPTSGMLLLMGGALLALRRRRQ